MEVESRSKISKWFNVVLFLYITIELVVNYLFEPVVEETTPWDAIYNVSPVLSIIAAGAITLILIFWGSKLLQIFWNRFVSDIFTIRNISFQESLAIILIIGVLFI